MKLAQQFRNSDNVGYAVYETFDSSLISVNKNTLSIKLWVAVVYSLSMHFCQRIYFLLAVFHLILVWFLCSNLVLVHVNDM